MFLIVPVQKEASPRVLHEVDESRQKGTSCEDMVPCGGKVCCNTIVGSQEEELEGDLVKWEGTLNSLPLPITGGIERKVEKSKHKCKIKNAYARKCQFNMVKSIDSYNGTLKIINKTCTIP